MVEKSYEDVTIKKQTHQSAAERFLSGYAAGKTAEAKMAKAKVKALTCKTLKGVFTRAWRLDGEALNL